MRTNVGLQHEPSDLWRAAGEALSIVFRGAPGLSVRRTSHSSLVLTGEPVADFNYAIVDAHPEAQLQLTDFVGLARAKQLPLVVIIADAAADALEPVARDLKLEYAGRMPLMTCRLMPTLSGDFEIVRVLTVAELAESNRLVAKGFSLPQESVDRAVSPAVLEAPGLDTFIARRLGVPMSSVQTTRGGTVVGIWSMATPPEHRRKGAARAALVNAMAHHSNRGATLFYLLATEAGRPLYENIGFNRIADGAIWVEGHSTQAPTRSA